MAQSRSAGRRWARSLPLLLGLALLSTCHTGLGPLEALPADAVGLVPPPGFAAWWSATEACAGRTGPPAPVDWFVVPDVSGFDTSEGHYVGLWSRGTNGSRIIIAGAYLNSEMVVRHEMLHALLDEAGHPTEYFVTRCHLTWDSWQG